MNLDLNGTLERRWIRIAVWSMVCALSILKFCYLTADFPNDSPWMIDQAKFTDEGWWGSAAVMHFVTGHWYVPGDYNPAVALPVWPLLLSLVFHFTGVSVVAARALNVAISIGTLAVVFALVRRYTIGDSETPALVAVLLLAASPFAFVFNRLAILDTLVVFEFCLLMLVASFASTKRLWPLAALAILVTGVMLTKTTAAVLLPAVFWIAWSAMDRGLPGLVRALLAAVIIPALLLKGYAVLVSTLGYGIDFSYFFGVNAVPEIEWRHTLSTLAEFFRDCFWIDRVLYPAGLVILVLAVAWKRQLWSNPLFASSWIALVAQAVFIFSRQDDFAPRYYLAMLAPLIWIVSVTFSEVIAHSRKASVLLSVVIAVSFVLYLPMIDQFITQRDYDFHDAALSIRGIIRSYPEQKALILGVSGNQLSLMTGIPSINDGYGTEDMAEKVARYQPGWFVAWNDVVLKDQDFLAGYELEKMASYPAFDDDDRGALTLYKMVRRANNPSAAPHAAVEGAKGEQGP
ncbi:MAG: ArnT family glycosyltransferase [Terracidiphilus sp.]